MKRTGTSVGRMKDEADGDVRGKDEKRGKLIESGIFALGRVKDPMEEADELIAILMTCVKNAKRGKR